MKTFAPYIFLATLLALAACKSDKLPASGRTKELIVNLAPTDPSYKEFFKQCDVIKLDSDPQAIMSMIKKVDVFNDSLLLFDRNKSNVFLFASDGKFLNRIGTIGEGPEDYYLCYDFNIHPTRESVCLLNPMGELVEYSKGGRFINRYPLTGKPNYYAFQWMTDSITAMWSIANEDEPAIEIANIFDHKVFHEDWYEEFFINAKRKDPFYRFGDTVYFTIPLGNDVYSVTDSCLELSYSWKFSPQNITNEYLDEIRQIEERNDMNELLNRDRRNGTMKDVPIFNGETTKYYYVALETGIGEDSTVKSVFYRKDNDTYTVFTKFKEGISFRPVFMNEDFMLCQIPYDEVDIYNDVFGLNFTCEEDENPLLAKFYFKK